MMHGDIDVVLQKMPLSSITLVQQAFYDMGEGRGMKIPSDVTISGVGQYNIAGT